MILLIMLVLLTAFPTNRVDQGLDLYFFCLSLQPYNNAFLAYVLIAP